MSRSDPAEQWAVVTPSDTVDMPRQRCRGIYSHDGGAIACVGRDAVVRIFTFAAGEIKPLAPVRVNTTGTTSTDIVALY